MAQTVSMLVSGLSELQEKFDKLALNMQRKHAQAAIRKGGAVFHKQAKSNAPIGPTGNLKKFLKLRSLKRSRRRFGVHILTGTRAELGIKKKAKGYYPTSVEFGTATMAANPFMRDAFRLRKLQAQSVIAKELAIRVLTDARAK